MHSFGLSERWLVLAEFPFVVNPLRLASSGRPYIENYRWKPELGTRFTLLDRSTGEARGPFTTDACFGFHHVNAYEDGDEVVVDICVFDDPQIVEDLYLERLRAGKPVARPELRRFRISPDAGTRRLPSASPTRRSSCRGSTTAAATSAPTATSGASGWASPGGSRPSSRSISKRRETTVWSEPGCFAGEPVFVAEPDGGGARTTGSCSRSCSTPSAGTRSCSCSTRPRSRSSRGPRRRTTSRSAFTASSRASGLRWEIPPMQEILQIS